MNYLNMAKQRKYMLKNINDLLEQHRILERQHRIEMQCHLDIIKECRAAIDKLNREEK